MIDSSTDRHGLMSSIDGLTYFYQVDYYKYSMFFNEFILNEHLSSADSKFRFLLKKHQFFTYEFSYHDNDFDDVVLARIGFKGLNQKDKALEVIIQLDATAIHLLGIKDVVDIIKEDLLLKGLCPVRSQLSKVDINAFVANYDFSNLERSHMKSRSRKGKVIWYTEFKKDAEYYSSTGIETIYFGKKDSPICLKMYDKIKEMRENKTFLKESAIISYFRAKYGKDFKINHLWNVEFMLKRDALKSFNLECLEDLWENANSLFVDLMRRYDYLDYSNTVDKTVSRVPTKPIWSFIRDNYEFNYEEVKDMSRIKKKRYPHNEYWLKNRFDEFMLDINDGMEVDYHVLEGIKNQLSTFLDEISVKTSYVQNRPPLDSLGYDESFLLDD